MKTSDIKILVVDDDPNTLEVIAEALVQAQYQVKKANQADEALRLMQSYSPTLVLTDYEMPGLTGLEMLNELRQQDNYTTVIFVSARGESSLVAKVLRAGADDYIRKPFRFEELMARIEASLRINHLHKDLMQANQQLQQMVELDYLTGLYNMRSMYGRIDLELKRAKRFGRNVSCIMMDMDHFKRVNDTNDHLFGSFVLKEVGEIIKKTMREIDFAARYGGDEFLMVLTETNEEGTLIFCNRLRENIKNFTFDDGKNQIKLTVSMGFAMSHGDEGYDARKLVRFADHALYTAKESGRDCVCVGQKENTDGGN